MADGYGDRLARGGQSAGFGVAPQLTQAQWDAIWSDASTGSANQLGAKIIVTTGKPADIKALSSEE